MLKSYQAKLDHGQILWQGEAPDVQVAQVIVTVLEPANQPRPPRKPPECIAGKGETLGDIVSPLVAEEDWECLR